MPERPEVIKMRENAHDRQYVLENVSKEGGLLDYAGEEMKDDREIALVAGDLLWVSRGLRRGRKT